MFKIFSEIKKMVSYFCEEKTFISIWFKKCEMWRTLNHKMVGIGLLPCLCSMVWSVVPVITKIHRIKHTIYIRPLSSVNCGSFCMNRTTFRDPWVGGVLVKTCIIALRRSTFLKEKQIHNVIKYSFLFGLTDL